MMYNKIKMKLHMYFIVSLGVAKALRSQKVMAMDVEGASVGMSMDNLGQNDGDEIQQATNYTSSKV